MEYLGHTIFEQGASCVRLAYTTQYQTIEVLSQVIKGYASIAFPLTNLVSAGMMFLPQHLQI